MSSEFAHTPVMLQEVLEAISPRPGGRYADGTIAGAGHAEAILNVSAPSGWLFGCDRDAEAVAAARARLARFTGRFEIRQTNYSELADWVPLDSCDGVLLDLGVSSPQLDVAERGFSFQREGPLDMRMDRRQTRTAGDVISGSDAEELERIFWEFGSEAQARRLARAIVRERERIRFETTKQLAEVVERISPRRGKRTHPATKIFQALRIAVNDEIGSLKSGLEAALKILKPGGRLAVITFHSLEDRVVKEFGRAKARDYTFAGVVDIPELRQARTPDLKWVTAKARKPGEAELAANPRSRSAQLRVMEKL